MLDTKLERNNKQQMCDELELNHVLDREVHQLSGGELQRFAIAMSCIQKADVYVHGLSPRPLLAINEPAFQVHV